MYMHTYNNIICILCISNNHCMCTLSGSATIIGHMATVTFMNLQCQQTYTITAGGILRNGMLIGPQFRRETITVGSCSTATQTSPPVSELMHM